jgi:DNA repair protein RadC
MLQKLNDHSADIFTDHELLEIALFYSIPRRNTNETAHALLERFGSLEGVINADPQRLMSVEGIGNKTASFFTLLSEIYSRCSFPSKKGNFCYLSLSSVTEFLKQKLAGESEECFCAMLFDNSMRLLNFVRLSEGSASTTPADVTKIARTAVLENAASVIIAHNHPDTGAVPSPADRYVTGLAETALSAVSVNLIEHIIVCEDSAIPIMISDFCRAPSAFSQKTDDSFYKKFYGS